MGGLLEGVLPAIFSGADEVKKRVKGLLTEPRKTMGLLNEDAASRLDQLKALAYQTGGHDPSQFAQSDPAWVAQQAAAAEQTLQDIAMQGIVSPPVARSLGIKANLPQSGEFSRAVANTPGAQIAEDGLLMRVTRNQKPEQGLMPSVRGGVMYLPEGSPNTKHYATGKNGYGGTERISGETLVQNPMFVKGGTGGKAPEAAYDQLMGKGAYQQMRKEALDVNPGTRSTLHPDKGPDIEDFLAKYAPEMQGQGQYILENSKQSNQLAYALQEAAVSSAVRKAGHDAVLGYSKGRMGKPEFLSELFDVRESAYPDKFGGYRLHDQFER